MSGYFRESYETVVVEISKISPAALETRMILLDGSVVELCWIVSEKFKLPIINMDANRLSNGLAVIPTKYIKQFGLLLGDKVLMFDSVEDYWVGVFVECRGASCLFRFEDIDS